MNLALFSFRAFGLLKFSDLLGLAELSSQSPGTGTGTGSSPPEELLVSSSPLTCWGMLSSTFSVQVDEQTRSSLLLYI
jgi:hypothetical protein